MIYVSTELWNAVFGGIPRNHALGGVWIPNMQGRLLFFWLTEKNLDCLLLSTQSSMLCTVLWPIQVKGKGSPYSIIERRVPELIPVLGSQPAGDVSHKPSGRLPLLSARPAVTPATLKRTATNFAAWWTEARWVWAVCLRLLPDSVATAIWTRALLRLSSAR